MNATAIDQEKLGRLVARAVGDLSSAYGGVMISLGSKLGLYKAMLDVGPISARELATRTGCAQLARRGGRGARRHEEHKVMRQDGRLRSCWEEESMFTRFLAKDSGYDDCVARRTAVDLMTIQYVCSPMGVGVQTSKASRDILNNGCFFK